MRSFNEIKRSKKGQYFFKITWILFLCVISALLARYVLIGISDMLAIGKPSDTVMVEIPENSSLDSIAEILKQNKKGAGSQMPPDPILFTEIKQRDSRRLLW